MAKQLKAEMSTLEDLLSQLENAKPSGSETIGNAVGPSIASGALYGADNLTGKPMQTSKLSNQRATHVFKFSLTFDEDWSQGMLEGGSYGGELCSSLASKLGIEASQVRVLGNKYHTGLSGMGGKGPQLGSLVVIFQANRRPSR